jgi:RNA polymerase sigma-70 factor, ECF subfamily
MQYICNMRDLEKKIIKELRYGSKIAFEYVFTTYYSSLCRYAEEMVHDNYQAEDIVTNLFVVLWDDRKNICIHTSLRSYLYRSTYNACLNAIRKKKTENKYKDYFIHHAEFSKNHDYGSSFYPLSEIIENELDNRLKEVIDNLPPRCREIFLLSRVEELSHKEIADELDISVNTVKSHIMNALKSIQSEIKNLLMIFIAIIPF